MAQITLSSVLESSTALMRAGRWNTATTLLQAITPASPAEHRAIAAALAEVAVDQDFAQHTDNADQALAVLEEALADSPDPVATWDLDFLHLRKDYGTALTAVGEDTQLETEDPDPSHAKGPNAEDAAGQRGAAGAGPALAKRVQQLRDTAPDDARSGHAAFYAGVIADNLCELPTDAFAAYTAARELGERSNDDLLVSLALRHLGDHAHTAGNLALARTHWERSTELRQKVGHLLGALAQQTLLAVLAKDEGNPTAATALATEVNRWSHQANLPWLEAQTAAILKETAR